MTIKIEDLDEFEGLTADIVRAWLRSQAPRVIFERGFWVWNPGATSHDKRGPMLGDQGIAYSITTALIALSAIEQRSIQSLLREINPRMRAGWPSEEERAKHRYWIAQEDVGSIDSLHIGCFDEDDEDGTPVFVAGYDLWTEEDVRRLDMKFWPCDQHGNKTRRGA